jgi:hypothetical protein
MSLEQTIVETILSNPQLAEKITSILLDKIKSVVFSGNNISGGVIRDFSSTGIKDQSKGVTLTLMPTATVCENQLITLDLKAVKFAELNNVRINGEIEIGNTEFYEKTSRYALNKLNQIDIELSSGHNFKINGDTVLDDKSLGKKITDSNLQRVGMLKDLQVHGEAYLSGILYVSPAGKIGINTTEPADTFTIWDEEVEMSICKRAKNQGFIGSRKKIDLAIGVNNEPQIYCLGSGEVVINSKLVHQGKSFATGIVRPGSKGKKGDVVWNQEPSVDAAIGWVCLGDANWASFGTIYE